MPTYGYKCTQCEHEFEVLQKITDEPIKECPECRGEVKKLLFPVGIVFKGSGFHVNDYKKSEKKTENETMKPKAESIKETVESTTE
ncbi:MAG: zinc ribbon domain-containing protein [Armatimonadetes bacterium]|nr:zinc ribbon domain-containing protein [Armatimonadota bacterium]